MRNITQKTIDDFGDQWGRYTKDDGYYASLECFKDIVEPALKIQDFSGKTVLDIGSGSGRIVRMLINAGASHVYALEPAEAAFATLKENTKDIADKITYLNCRGDQIPQDLKVDIVVSIGVIHHIFNPEPVMKDCYRILKPGGQCLIWLYGKEGNELYLSLALPLRSITTRLPHAILAMLCHILNVFLFIYISACRILPLPMYKYFRGFLQNLPYSKRYLAIYDQLNPAYAKYYTKSESLDLMSQAGFTNLFIHHRHDYSWTVAGQKA